MKSNQRILNDAISKANLNGFVFRDGEEVFDDGWNIEPYIDAGMVTAYGPSGIRSYDGYRVIFSHDFAEAFWGGDANEYSYHAVGITTPAWQWFLQQMVLEPNPIQYLKQFIDDK